MIHKTDFTPLVVLAVIVLVAICFLGYLVNDKIKEATSQNPSEIGNGNPANDPISSPDQPEGIAVPSERQVEDQQATTVAAQAQATQTVIAQDRQATPAAARITATAVKEQQADEKAQRQWHQTLPIVFAIMALAVALSVVTLVAVLSYKTVVETRVREVEAQLVWQGMVNQKAGETPSGQAAEWNRGNHHQLSNRGYMNIPPSGSNKNAGSGNGSYIHKTPHNS